MVLRESGFRTLPHELFMTTLITFGVRTFNLDKKTQLLDHVNVHGIPLLIESPHEVLIICYRQPYSKLISQQNPVGYEKY
jgi:hypothetical protein